MRRGGEPIGKSSVTIGLQGSEDKKVAIINGTKRADVLNGTAADDVISGRDGDDRLIGGNGDDVLRPGNGKDVVLGGAGDDTVVVTEYDERFPDTIGGQAGFDTLNLSRAPTMNGDYYFEWEYFKSQDTFKITDFFNDDRATITFDGFEKMIGSSGIDYFRFSDASVSFTILTGNGDDYASAGSGNDMIDGGSGDDALYSGGGRNVLSGGIGRDYLCMDDSIGGSVDGGAGRDAVLAYGTINLEQGTGLSQSSHRYTVSNVEDLDVHFGAIGSVATGDANANRIDATYSIVDATLNGGAGNDYLIGSGSGKDTLRGGDGDDRLMGTGGADILFGGAGRDIFDMTSATNASISDNTDIIRDFSQEEADRIYIWTAAGNHSVSFIGSRDFGNVEHELRFEQHDGKTYVQLDNDGDGVSDLDIALTGMISLRASDFIDKYVPEPLTNVGLAASAEAMPCDASPFVPPFPPQDLGMVALV